MTYKTLAVGLTGLLAGFVHASDNPESCFQANPRHTGVYEVAPMGGLKQIRFMFQTHGAIRSTPAIAGGALYFGSGDDNFYAVDTHTGKELWRFRTGGSVHSSPAVTNGSVYFTSRDGILYALNAANGREQWHLQFGEDLPYQYGFEYYTSSPTVENGVVYVGSGDGNLYALDAKSGKQLWKFAAGSRVQDSPALTEATLVFGTMSGHVIALDKQSGKEVWDYATFGTTLKFEDFGFDRAAIVSSPSIANGVVTVGSRDGFLYALDLVTGSLKWKFDHKVSWAISTPGRADGKVYCGTSDGHFVQSVDESTGKEEWRFPSVSGVWSSPVITGGELYCGDFGGNLYGIDRKNGTEIWRFKTGGPVYASPTVDDRTLFCGSDDGYLYALEGTGRVDSLAPMLRKTVFWEDAPGFKWFQHGIDTWIRDYFKGEGYEVVDAKGLAALMEEAGCSSVDLIG